MSLTDFPAFFDRVYIINLASRPDRRASILAELDRLGWDRARDRIEIPEAPMPADDGGFVSKGVHGNYLSHLEILRDAHARGLTRTLVLEDDAIFLNRLRRRAEQAAVLRALEAQDWGTWFPGHLLRGELKGMPRGQIVSALPFTWAHCYGVHGRALGPLIAFLEASMARPRGHAEGGRMYIDAGLSLFRARHPEYPSVISNPALSVQKGTTSNLARNRGYDAWRPGHLAAGLVRWARDQIWRYTGEDFRRTQDPDGLIAAATRGEQP